MVKSPFFFNLPYHLRLRESSKKYATHHLAVEHLANLQNIQRKIIAIYSENEKKEFDDIGEDKIVVSDVIVP